MKRGAAACLLPLLFVALAHGAPSSGDIAAACPNALSINDPVCANGGTLHLDDDPGSSLSCANCDCPAEWAGNDCSLCTAAEHCPPKYNEHGQPLQLVGCTADSMEPTELEYSTGKSFSCTCGGDDKSTQFLCNQQPGTNWDIHLLPSNDTVDWYSGKAVMTVVERSGTPQQNYTPACPSGDQCPTAERYRYAYPQVWKGAFTGCSWSQGDCISPLTGSDCIVFSCDDADIACPPAELPKCPKYTPWGCDKPANESLPYWSHHCIPSSYPQAGKAVTLACKQRPDNGTYQCYIAQEGAYVASLGMQCRTGTCVYNDTARPPAPPHPHPQPPPVPAWRKIKHVEVVVLVFVGLMVVSVVAAAGLLIHRDTRHTEKWLSEWARLEGEGEGGAGNGAAAAGAANGANGHGWGRLVTYDRLQGARHSRTTSGHHFRTASGGLVSLPSTVVLTWDSIQYTIYKASGHRRRVLKGVFGIAGQTRHIPGQPGLSMCAILGPSGAGKTTLLDILSGRRTGLGLTGEIRINGVPVTPEAVKGISGYVLQDDVLPGTLTVWEYLMFVASLRLPPEEYGEEERRGRIASILQQLALTKVTNSTIGDAFVRGLSGGERRRVGIAAELLTRPSMLFLDEPTTGLDSTNAARVVDVLADLAAGGGVNVLLSIHQPRPDIFRLMERVVLLSSFGQVVYSGPVAAAEEHFAALGYRPAEASINIADYMLDTIIRSSNEEVDRMVEEFRHSRIAADDEAISLALARAADPSTLPAPKYSAPYGTQLRALATRLLRNTYRHPFLIMLNFAATLFTAVSLALIFHGTGVDTGGIQNRFGVLFFMLLYLSLMSLSSLPIWREEKLLFIRERDAGLYGTAAYYGAVVIFDLIPLRVIPPTFFALISYPIIGLHPNCGTCILWFIAVLVLSNVAAATMCMAIGAAAPSNSAANLVGSLLIMMFLLFGGFLLNKDSVPEYCRWISSASYFNYAYEALAVNEFHKAPMDFNFTAPIPTADIPPIRISGDGVLREFGFRHELFYLDVFMLCFIGGCTCALTYAFLLVTGHSMWDVLKTLLSKGIAAATRRTLLLLHRIAPLQPILPNPPPPPTPGPQPFPHRPARLPSTSSSTRGSTPTSSLPRVSSATFAPAEDYVTISEEAMEEVDCMDSAGGCLGVSLLGGRAAGGDVTQPLLLDVDGDDREDTREVDPVVLSWENVCFRVPLPRGRSRLILRSITAVAGPAPSDGGAASPTRRGCLFAVLGPSGAGKTTLIDILSGRNHGSGASGEIRANGHLVSARTRRKMSGYVLQDDVLPGTSTVLEYLTFHARLRLPSHYTREQLQRRVHRIIAELSLAKVAHSYIGDAFVRGLSGGERRRVGIAAELLTRPAVLFLDEPTTGLDSTNAARVVDVLADLAAAGGVNVLLSIHQPRPDIFRLMDRILILSGNGQVVYTGPTQAAREHFASLGLPAPPPTINIADHLLDLVIKSPPATVQGLAQRFQGSAAARADEQWMADLQLGDAYHSLQRGRVLLQLSKYEAGYWRQLEVLSGRLAKNMLRHPLLIMLNFVATAVMAVGIGMVYWEAGHDTGGIQDRMGSLFFMLLYLSLMSLSSLPIWADDRLLFVRERAAGAYGTPAYFTAVVLFDLLPMRLLPPVFFAALSYPMIGLRPGWQYAVYNLVVLVLGNMTAAALSMALGAASSGVSMANMTGSLAVLSTTLFGGFLLSRNRMPRVLSWAASLSYVRYAYEALVANEFHGATGFKFTGYHQPGTPEEHVPFVAVTGDTVLALFGFRPGAYASDVWMLLVFLGVYLAATFLLLKYKGRP